MSTIILIFISLFCTYVTIFKTKNVSEIYDNIIWLDLISANLKQILHFKQCIVWNTT